MVVFFQNWYLLFQAGALLQGTDWKSEEEFPSDLRKCLTFLAEVFVVCDIKNPSRKVVARYCMFSSRRNSTDQPFTYMLKQGWLLQVDLSSLTHSVPWVIEELDAVDGGRYPWFYSGCCQKNPSEELIISWITQCIERHFWRDEEMIELSFFGCIQIMISFMLILCNHFLCFLLPFFLKVQSKIGVHIIHRCALYMGKYSNDTSHWYNN